MNLACKLSLHLEKHGTLAAICHSQTLFGTGDKKVHKTFPMREGGGIDK